MSEVAGNEGARERGVEERLVTHLLERRRKVGDGELVAIAKRRIPDAPQTFGQHDLPDMRVLHEGVRLDFHRSRSHDVSRRLVVKQTHEALTIIAVAV